MFKQNIIYRHIIDNNNIFLPQFREEMDGNHYPIWEIS